MNTKGDVPVKKYIMFSDLPISGFYKFDDVFQMIPPPDDWPKPRATIGHHPILIEYKDEIAVELIDLLSVFSNYYFFQYSNNQAWFIDLANHKNDSVWGQEVYKSDIVNQIEFESEDFSKHEKEIDFIEHNEYFNTYAGRLRTDPINFPESLSDLYRKYLSLDTEKRKAYRNASILFKSGLLLKDERINLSLAYVSFISCIETLIYYEHKDEDIERCKHCGQLRYRTTRKFKDFMEKYISKDKDFQKYSQDIYNIRSQIIHRGQLLISDEKMFELMDSVKIEYLIRLTRITMVNWLVSN